jgi:preprotein translocase subunit SecD
MEFYRDNRIIFLTLAFLVFAASIVVFAGWLLLAALLFFGFVSVMWKEPHIKLASITLLVLLALINIGAHGLNFGIDFVGGTRIPVVLEHSVDQGTMDELVQTIKSRANTLGLKEVKARAIGTSLVNVEIASTDEAAIDFIEKTLSQQGVFLGVVDGKVAVSGDRIHRSLIRPLGPSELVQQGADWGVAFSVDREGAEMFAEAAKNKADYPIYMFLDRPDDTAIFYTREQFKKYLYPDSGENESMRALARMLALEGGRNISAYIIEALPADLAPGTNGTKALISSDAPQAAKDMLAAKGFTVVEMNESRLKVEFSRTRSGILIVNKLEAAGLLTAPLLGGAITNGMPNYNYVVTGSVNATDPRLKAKEASERVKSIESILKGGALPVQISLGSRTTLPAALGSEFLKLSLVAIGASLVFISILIGIRYRNIRATAPIVVISLAELVVLLSILGSFTIDLAAMAGIIAAIGVGVDAQIVITDETLKKDDHTTHEKVELAFGIIRTNAIVAIFSMVPLLFSGLVEIIGFAMSTMLGALLGYLITRPAYAAILEKVLEAERKGQAGKAAEPHG